MLPFPNSYSVHLHSTCENRELRSASICHAHQGLFAFNLSYLMEEQLPPGLTLRQVGWPDGLTSLSRSHRAMHVAVRILCVAELGGAGLVIVLAVVHVVVDPGHALALAVFIANIVRSAFRARSTADWSANQSLAGLHHHLHREFCSGDYHGY